MVSKSKKKRLLQQQQEAESVDHGDLQLMSASALLDSESIGHRPPKNSSNEYDPFTGRRRADFLMCLAKLEEKLENLKAESPTTAPWMELTLSFFYMPEVFHYISKEQEVESISFALSLARRVSIALTLEDSNLIVQSTVAVASALRDLSGKDFRYFVDQIDNLSEKATEHTKPPRGSISPENESVYEDDLDDDVYEFDFEDTKMHEWIEEDYSQWMKEAREDFIHDLGVPDTIPTQLPWGNAESSYKKFLECIDSAHDEIENESVLQGLEQQLLKFTVTQFNKNYGELSVDKKLDVLYRQCAMAQYSLHQSDFAIRRLEKQQNKLKEEQSALTAKNWRLAAYIDDLVKASSQQTKEITKLRQELALVRAQSQKPEEDSLATQITSSLMKDLKLSDGVQSTLKNVFDLFTRREKVYQEFIKQKNLEAAASMATIHKLRQVHNQAVKRSTASIFEAIKDIISGTMVHDIQEDMKKLMVLTGVLFRGGLPLDDDNSTEAVKLQRSQIQEIRDVNRALLVVGTNVLSAMNLLIDLKSKAFTELHEQDLSDIVDFGVKLEKFDSERALAIFEKQTEKLSSHLMQISESIRKYALGDTEKELGVFLPPKKDLSAIVRNGQFLEVEAILTAALRHRNIWLTPAVEGKASEQSLNDIELSTKITDWISSPKLSEPDKTLLSIDLLREISRRLISKLETTQKNLQEKSNEESETRKTLEGLLSKLGEPLSNSSNETPKLNTLLEKLDTKIQEIQKEKKFIGEFVDDALKSIEDGSKNRIQKASFEGLPAKLYELTQKIHQKDAELRVSAMVLIQHFESHSNTPLDNLPTTSLLKLLESNIGQVILDERLLKDAVTRVLKRLSAPKSISIGENQSVEVIVEMMELAINDKLEDITVAEALMNSVYTRIREASDEPEGDNSNVSKPLRVVSELLSDHFNVTTLENRGNIELSSSLNQLLTYLGLADLAFDRKSISSENIEKLIHLIRRVSIPLRHFSKNADASNSKSIFTSYAEEKITAVELMHALLEQEQSLRDDFDKETRHISQIREGMSLILKSIDAPETIFSQSHEQQIQHIVEHISNKGPTSWQEEKTFMEAVEKTLKNFIVCLCDSIDIEENFVKEALKTWDFPSILLCVLERFQSARNTSNSLQAESVVLCGRLARQLRAEKAVVDLLRNELTRLKNHTIISKEDLGGDISLLLNYLYSEDRKKSFDEIFDSMSRLLSSEVSPSIQKNPQKPLKPGASNLLESKSDSRKTVATLSDHYEERRSGRQSSSNSEVASRGSNHSYHGGAGSPEKSNDSARGSSKADKPRLFSSGITKSERPISFGSGSTKGGKQSKFSDRDVAGPERSPPSGHSQSNEGSSSAKGPIKSIRGGGREIVSKPSPRENEKSGELGRSQNGVGRIVESRSPSGLLSSYSQYFTKNMIGEGPAIPEPDLRELENAGNKFYYSRKSLDDNENKDSDDGPVRPEREPLRVFGPERPPQMIRSSSGRH